MTTSATDPRAPTPPRSRHVNLGSAIAGAAAGAVAVMSGRLDLAILVVTVGSIPFLHAIGSRRPDVLVGLFVLAQPLEAFELRTPVTTVSVGNILLVVLLLTSVSSYRSMLRTSRVTQVATALLLGWLLMYPLRALHDPLGQVLRSSVTMASFVLVAVAGMAVARHPGALRAIALGAFGALMVLATAGILVNLGMAPTTLRYEPARNLLGFTSPFMRTYGLDVPVDAVSLLVPLCVPFLSVHVFDRHSSRVDRLFGILAIGLVGLASLLIFQGRGMLLQIAIAIALAGLLAVPGRYRIGVAIALGAALFVVAAWLITADQLSSGLRSGIGLYTIESILADPARFLMGVPEGEFYLEAARSLGLQEYAPADSAVHNFFLSTLVGGGLFAFILIVAFHALAIWVPFVHWRSAPSLASRAMLVAVVVVLVGLSIEPARAGIVGSWLVLGVAIGRGTIGKVSSQQLVNDSQAFEAGPVVRSAGSRFGVIRASTTNVHEAREP
ncbi:MAG: O-antigen ligase family protein [Candidatus Limnocylindrales bacterium]